MLDNSTKNQFKKLGIAVLIPTYNNQKTLSQLIDSVLEYTDDVIIVNDGATDTTEDILKNYSEKAVVISYKPNRGKGFALKTGFRKAVELGFNYVISIDSDGQHFAKDFMLFLQKIETEKDILIVGSRYLKQENMPQKNTFANKFSNFWFRLQTGIPLPDTQSGFRLYPLRKMGNMKLFTNRYETELELLVFSAWRGIKISYVPISVYYAPKEEKVSHFRPFQDFFRISLLNSLLVFLAVVYGYPSIFIRRIFRR